MVDFVKSLRFFLIRTFSYVDEIEVDYDLLSWNTCEDKCAIDKSIVALNKLGANKETH